MLSVALVVHMPTHQELIADTPTFIQSYPYSSAEAACLAVLLQNAVYQTLGGGAVGAGVPANNIPAPITLGNVQNAINHLAARVTAGARGDKWAWFSAVNATQPMAWGLMQQAHVQSNFRLFNNDPGGLGTAKQRRAYYLPYRPNGITCVKLRNAADFCFTAPLGGCTIYMYRPVGQSPWLFHANAAGAPAAQKQTYMDLLFEAITNVPANHATVTAFRSNNYMNLNVQPGITWEQARKYLMLRHHVEWSIVGANVMGRRAGHDTWNFYWQTVRLLGYERFAVLEYLRSLFVDGPGRVLSVQKPATLAVHASGVL